MLGAGKEELLFVPVEDLVGKHAVHQTVSAYSSLDRLAINVDGIYHDEVVINLVAALKNRADSVPKPKCIPRRRKISARPYRMQHIAFSSTKILRCGRLRY